LDLKELVKVGAREDWMGHRGDHHLLGLDFSGIQAGWFGWNSETHEIKVMKRMKKILTLMVLTGDRVTVLLVVKEGSSLKAYP
jgi:hypothetical protein